MPSMRDVLLKARELITEPEGWTQGVFARNVTGNPVPTSSPDAAQFCLTGACYRACTDLWRSEPDPSWDPARVRAMEKIVDTLRGGEAGDVETIYSYNDDNERTHAEVLDLLDRTIARCRVPKGADRG